MAELTSRIDWLSVSVPGDGVHRSQRSILPRIRDIVHEYTGEDLDDEPTNGRAFQQFRIPGDGVTAFYSLQGDVTIEISGMGCERLHRQSNLWAVVDRAVQSAKITRFDHATDILTPTAPKAFALKRSNNAHKTYSHAVSESGETYYVGSRKSDRFCRVYRYNPPHPRSDLLRIEHVFRRAYAHSVAKDWLKIGDDEFAARAGKIYGWEHETWTPDTETKLSYTRPSRGNVNTILWLYSSVAPAVAKLVTSGELTQEEAVRAVLSRLPGQHG